MLKRAVNIVLLKGLVTLNFPKQAAVFVNHDALLLFASLLFVLVSFRVLLFPEVCPRVVKARVSILLIVIIVLIVILVGLIILLLLRLLRRLSVLRVRLLLSLLLLLVGLVLISLVVGLLVWLLLTPSLEKVLPENIWELSERTVEYVSEVITLILLLLLLALLVIHG